MSARLQLLGEEDNEHGCETAPNQHGTKCVLHIVVRHPVGTLLRKKDGRKKGEGEGGMETSEPRL